MKHNINDELINFSHSVRVMFVEDGECSKNGSEEMLELFFSNIDKVFSCEEAYEHFLQRKYDLIITVLSFPNMDGMELIRKIRAISKDITILVVSSDNDQYGFSELIKLGVDGYIIRPVYMKQFSDVIHKTIEKLKNKQELYEYRIDLEKRVSEQVDSLRHRDKILAYQSKLAAMGEMMDAVAHQWKQPLNIINMKMDMLRYDYDDGLVDKGYCDKLYEDISTQTLHMRSTLDEFRTFLRPDKETEEFSLSAVIDKVLLLVHDELLRYKIVIEKDIRCEYIIDGIENEFKHLLLNLLSNSKDAFEEKGIKKRKIKFEVFEENGKTYLEVSDNAGGIPENIIDDIFKANVTSKSEGKGTGIGLYMSQQIVNKHRASIKACNIEGGSKFIVTF